MYIKVKAEIQRTFAEKKTQNIKIKKEKSNL